MSYAVQEWLGRLGGTIIIIFGLWLLGFLSPDFLKREHGLFRGKRFGSSYLTSFVFGAAFAVGWTPCVSAALGAILALAITQTSSAFLLLFAYTLGLGLPFLLVGLFTEQAQTLIRRAGPRLIYVQYFFGLVLIVMGMLVFTGQLSRVANLEIVVRLLERLNLVSSVGGTITSLTFFNVGLAWLAGLGSFLSPCVLPLLPGFLSYLASTSTTGQPQE